MAKSMRQNSFLQTITRVPMTDDDGWIEVGPKGKPIYPKKLSDPEKKVLRFAPLLAKPVLVTLRDGAVAIGRLYTVSPNLDFALRDGKITRNGITTGCPASKTMVIRHEKWVSIRAKEETAVEGFKTDAVISSKTSKVDEGVDDEKKSELVPFFDQDDNGEGEELGADGPETGWDSASMIRAFDQRNPGKTSYRGIDNVYTNVEVPVLDPALARRVDEMARRTRPTDDEYVEGRDEEAAFASVARVDVSQSTRYGSERNRRSHPYGQRVFTRQKNPQQNQQQQQQQQNQQHQQNQVPNRINSGRQFSSGGKQQQHSMVRYSPQEQYNRNRAENPRNVWIGRGRGKYHGNQQRFPRLPIPDKRPSSSDHGTSEVRNRLRPVVNEWELRKQRLAAQQAATAQLNRQEPIAATTSSNLNDPASSSTLETSSQVSPVQQVSAGVMTSPTNKLSISETMIVSPPKHFIARPADSVFTSNNNKAPSSLVASTEQLSSTGEQITNHATSSIPYADDVSVTQSNRSASSDKEEELWNVLNTVEEYIPSTVPQTSCAKEIPLMESGLVATTTTTGTDTALNAMSRASDAPNEEEVYYAQPEVSEPVSVSSSSAVPDPILQNPYLVFQQQGFGNQMPFDSVQHQMIATAYLNFASNVLTQHPSIAAAAAAAAPNIAYFQPHAAPNFNAIAIDPTAQLLTFLNPPFQVAAAPQQVQGPPQPFYTQPGGATSSVAPFSAQDMPYISLYPFPAANQHVTAQPIFPLPPPASTYVQRVTIPPHNDHRGGRPNNYRGRGFGRGRRSSMRGSSRRPSHTAETNAGGDGPRE
ncbi:hypothetical protein ACOME3_009058 [Neoechinorhynchus agilis]